MMIMMTLLYWKAECCNDSASLMIMIMIIMVLIMIRIVII